MAYNSKNFSVMAYANGFTLWNYSTEDTLETLRAADYFNEVSSFVRKGDMILVVANNQAIIESAIINVATVADNVVAVAQVAPVMATA